MQRPHAVPTAGTGEPSRPRRGIKLPKPSDYEVGGHARLYLRCPSCAGAIAIAVPDPDYRGVTCNACGITAVRGGR